MYVQNPKSYIAVLCSLADYSTQYLNSDFLKVCYLQYYSVSMAS